MKLYHGTTVPGLDVLRAGSLDREGKPVLYLTDNYPYSLFYIRDRDINFVTCGVNADGMVRYDEKFSGQLQTLYREMAGWVYEVEVDAKPGKANGIYIALGDARITGKTYIPDVWQAIQNEIARGTVKLLAYEDTTEAQRAMNWEGIVRLFQSEQNIHPKKEVLLRSHFPGAWEEAKRRNLDKFYG